MNDLLILIFGLLAGILLGIWLSSNKAIKIKNLRKRTAGYVIHNERLALIGEIIAGVVHELNNPLTSVVGYSTLLDASSSPEEMKKYAKAIYKEAERCRRIVKDLLNFSRRKDHALKEVCNLNELYTEVLELKKFSFSKLDITPIVLLDPSAPLVIGDGHELQQVLLNLLNNAEQAMSGQLTPKLIRVAIRQADNQVEVTVSDSGPGVPLSIEDKIFEPFFTTKKKGEGTGLGLTLCRDIIEKHGGTLKLVRDGHESGATFKFVLPPTKEVPMEKPAITVSSNSDFLKNLRVVVVDDEPTLIRFYETALKPMGCKVRGFEKLNDALEFVQENSFDVIIMDYKMRGGNTKPILDYVHEHKPELAKRIILSSGNSYDPEMLRLIKEVGNIFLPKPFTLNEATEAMRKALSL